MHTNESELTHDDVGTGIWAIEFGEFQCPSGRNDLTSYA
jgi:hypothetical protein